MKRLTWGEVVAVVGIVLVLAAILYPVFTQTKSGPRRDPCLTNLKQQGIALAVYADDSNDRLPPRDSWMDATDAYVRNERARHCPQALPKGAYGYAFNGALDRKPLSQIEDVTTTPMAYDSVNPIRDASDLFKSLPSPGRHKGRDTVVYGDAHAKTVVVP